MALLSYETYIRGALDLQEVRARFGSSGSDIADFFKEVWDRFDSNGLFKIADTNVGSNFDASSLLTVEGMEVSAVTYTQSVFLGAPAATGTYAILRSQGSVTVTDAALTSQVHCGATDASNYWAIGLEKRAGGSTASTDLYATNSDTRGYIVYGNTDTTSLGAPDQNSTLTDGQFLTMTLTKTAGPPTLTGACALVEYRVTS